MVLKILNNKIQKRFLFLRIIMGNATHIVTLFILIKIFKNQWIEIYDVSDISYWCWLTFKINGQILEASWNITFRYYVTIFCTIAVWEMFLTNESTKYCHIFNLRIFVIFLETFSLHTQFLFCHLLPDFFIFPSSFVLPCFFFLCQKKKEAGKKGKWN